MIDAQTVDVVLRNDPDVSVVERPAEFVYTADVSVEGMALPGRIFISGATSTTCIVFTTESVSDLAGAFRASERVANVSLALDDEGEFCFRAAVFKEDSLPLAVTNTLQALAFVKITYDERSNGQIRDDADSSMR